MLLFLRSPPEHRTISSGKASTDESSAGSLHRASRRASFAANLSFSIRLHRLFM
jgi:hypothetical protein